MYIYVVFQTYRLLGGYQFSVLFNLWALYSEHYVNQFRWFMYIGLTASTFASHCFYDNFCLNSWIRDTRIASYSFFKYSSRQVLMLSCNIPSLAQLQISPLERLANTTKSAKEIGSMETHPAFSKRTFLKKGQYRHNCNDHVKSRSVYQPLFNWQVFNAFF